ncbi:MAG: hypothetical protein JNL62_00720 [Bryobacterales bacterium]|nr:hypothetical protein [Bryobacterales bacterium]
MVQGWEWAGLILYIMSNVISEYQRWKQQGESLRTQAKTAIETRFKELLNEAAQLAEEYRADFGAQLKPPNNITAFRYKTGVKPKGKKAAAKPAAAAKVEPVVATPEVAAKPDKKVAALVKRLEAAKKKLDAAKAAGQPTRNLEDKVYEIEDEVRLATHAV